MIGVYTHVVVRHGVPDRAALGGDELVAALVDDAYAHLTLVPLLPEAPGRRKKKHKESSVHLWFLPDCRGDIHT